MSGGRNVHCPIRPPSRASWTRRSKMSTGPARKTVRAFSKKLQYLATPRDTTEQSLTTWGPGHMAAESTAGYRVQLKTLFQHGALGALDDSRLLELFVAGRAGLAEAAF